MLIAPALPPGLYRNGTAYQSQGRYFDADLYRWYEGVERPIGGWRKKSLTAAPGKARATISWVDNSGLTWTAVGTNEGLFVYTRSGVRHVITPVGFVPGPADATTGGGYGGGAYGTGAYGAPRPDTMNVIPAMIWSLGIWGENLIACDGEAIYQWELGTGTPAAPLPNAPSATAVLITDERIIMAFGAGGDPRKIEWSDAEDNTVWTPAGTNLAGGDRIQTSGRLIGGRAVRGGYLIFSDTDVHLGTYVNLPDVYSFDRLATGCGLISLNSVAVMDSRAVWQSQNSFWQYNGGVDPLPCDIGDDLFKTLNRGQSSKIFAWHNSQFGEVWFHYPSSSSIEIDRYAVYNYRENHWNRGAMVRLSGADRGVLPYPMLVDGSGFLFEHEVGQFKDGRQPFALSGPIELGKGDRTMEVETIIPDQSNLGDVAFSFEVGDWPMDETYIEGPFSSLAQTDVRFSGRRVAFRKVAIADQDFRVGQTRFSVQSGSPR